jgi:hypothetical protein
MVKELYPKLEIADKAANEVEYSRADISKLKGILDCKFMSIDQQLPTLIKSML